MTRLDELTQNPDRSIAILAIVNEAIGEGDCSLETVSLKTDRFGPSFGDLNQDEFDAAVAMLPQPVEPVTAESSAAPVADQDAPIMTRDEANAELKRRTEALMAARKARMIAEDDLRRAREAMDRLRLEWRAGGPTADQIRRNELAAMNKDRASKVEPDFQRRPGPSVIDQNAFYGTHGDASSYVRKQHRFGSHHRATALTDGGLLQRPGQRGTRLPSER
jgi:hypothetical protein